jgi:hypothetical protein
MYPESEVKPVTGNTGSCYICARSFAGLQPEAAVRKDYGRPVRYFITFCWWCVQSHKL